MIPSASYPGKKTSSNQFSKCPPLKKKPASDQADSYAAALDWAGTPGRLGSYRMKPTSLNWNKNLKKFVKTQGHNLKMSFLRPNLWIGLGFWVKKQIILWFLTWNVLTIFFEKERQIFLDCELGLSIVAKGNERHIAIWRKKKLRAVFFELLTVTGTYPQVGTQVKKDITTNPC